MDERPAAALTPPEKGTGICGWSRGEGHEHAHSSCQLTHETTMAIVTIVRAWSCVVRTNASIEQGSNIFQAVL